MHMYCFGSDQPELTWLFEHGGGSNSISSLPLAREIQTLDTTNRFRYCVYDRLGYGFTSSMVTGEIGVDVDESSQLALKLLSAAGVPVSQPLACVGHSAGADQCVRLAVRAGDRVSAVVMLDGYPDLIAGGAFRPGVESDDSTPPPSPALHLTGFFAFMAGPTGFTRNLVGDPGDEFPDHTLRRAMTALYAQSRFWFSQFWDLKSSLHRPYVFQQIGGSVTANHTVRYSRSLASKILIIPAHSTVTALNCTNTPSDFCCQNAQESVCVNNQLDKNLYLEQAQLYATTLSKNNGSIVIAPSGSTHGFPYDKNFVRFTAETIFNLI